MSTLCTGHARRLRTAGGIHGRSPAELGWLPTARTLLALSALGGALGTLIAVGTAPQSRAQDDAAYESGAGYDGLPQDEYLPEPVEVPPEKEEVFTVVELPSGNEITVSVHDEEKEAELPVDEERTARPDWLVEVKEPEPMPEKLAERVEILSAEREAMAEAAGDEPILEIAPLDPSENFDAKNPDGVNRVESVISDVAPPAAPPPGPPRKDPYEAAGEQLDALQSK